MIAPFRVLAVAVVISGVYFSSPGTAFAGALFAFVYMGTFIAIIEVPAEITPLPIFAMIAAGAVIVGCTVYWFKPPAAATYNKL